MHIFILDLTPGFNGLGKRNCKTERKSLCFEICCLLYQICYGISVDAIFIQNKDYYCQTQVNIITRKRFPHYWSFVREIRQLPLSSRHRDNSFVIWEAMTPMWRHCNACAYPYPGKWRHSQGHLRLIYVGIIFVRRFHLHILIYETGADGELWCYI